MALTLPPRRTRHRRDGDSFYTLGVRERSIGIGLIALLAAVLNPQNIGIVIMLGVIAILLDERWHPAPTQPRQPSQSTRRTTDKKA